MLLAGSYNRVRLTVNEHLTQGVIGTPIGRNYRV